MAYHIIAKNANWDGYNGTWPTPADAHFSSFLVYGAEWYSMDAAGLPSAYKIFAGGIIGEWYNTYNLGKYGVLDYLDGVMPSSSSSSSIDSNSSSSSKSESSLILSQSSSSSYHEHPIQYIELSATCNNAGLTHVLIPKPTNLAVGNLMIAQVVSQSTGIVTPPDNWTEIASTGLPTAGAFGTYWKFATDSDVAESTFHFGFSGDGANVGRIYTFSGVDTGEPISVSSYATGTNTACTAPTINIPTYNNTVVFMACSGFGRNSFSNYGITTDNPDTWVDLGGKACVATTSPTVAMAYAWRWTSGATGTGFCTMSNTAPLRQAGIMVALQPRGATESTSSVSEVSSSSQSISSSSSSESKSESSLSLSSFSESLSSESISSSSSLSSMSDSSGSSSSENVYNLVGYIVVEVNGSTTKNHFLPIYDHYTIGYIESDRVFWSCFYSVEDLTNLVEDGYLSMTVNGDDYWLNIWTADAVSCDCCSDLVGTWRPV